MGSLPDWKPILQAARWLGVAPWDLLEQPLCWTNWALEDERVDIEARVQFRKEAEAASRQGLNGR